MIHSITKKIRRKVRKQYVHWRFAKSQKIFCIGSNKTGTTSLKHFFKQLGFTVGPQKEAELLIFDWHNEHFDPIVEYVRKSGQFFQDVPFSLNNTYKVMDKAFPDSKFILTVRGSASEWYDSLVSFHSKIWGNGNVPTKEDLQEANYRYPGFPWEAFKRINGTPEDDLYNKKIMIDRYESHNKEVIEYFRETPEKLLVINLKDADASERVKLFLGLKGIAVEMPWKNKTSEINAS